jgi:hypothetical protein
LSLTERSQIAAALKLSEVQVSSKRNLTTLHDVLYKLVQGILTHRMGNVAFKIVMEFGAKIIEKAIYVPV